SETSFNFGPDGAGFNQSVSRRNEQGTTRTASVGAEFDKDGNASVNGSYTIANKDGKSFTVSAHAGGKVVASEPKKVGDQFVVTYLRTKSVGAGVGGSGKAGPVTVGAHASAEATDFEEGSRTFKTEKEAEEFREHAAEWIAEIKDPHSVAGAMSMAIGESRG